MHAFISEVNGHFVGKRSSSVVIIPQIDADVKKLFKVEEVKDEKTDLKEGHIKLRTGTTFTRGRRFIIPVS